MSSLSSAKFSTPGGSKGGVGTTVKKKQQEYKALVGNFVKLMTNWTQDVEQIAELLGNLSNVMSTMEAVQRLQSRHPKNIPLFDELFTDAYGLLLGNMHTEVELLYHQLKLLLAGMGDVVVAMRMSADEATKLATNESPEAFGLPDEVIFTTDHLLDIVQLSGQYVVEHDRKRALLLREVFAESGESNTSVVGGGTASSRVLAAAGLWPDDTTEDTSFVDLQFAEAFLVMNGGGYGGSGAD